MYIDDHDQMHGGLKNTISVRISPEELLKLKRGETVHARNKRGNKLQVVLFVESIPREMSSS